MKEVFIRHHHHHHHLLNHRCRFQEPGVPLTDEEVSSNEQIFNETIANEFPEEDFLVKTFRDKVIIISCIFKHDACFMILYDDSYKSAFLRIKTG